MNKLGEPTNDSPVIEAGYLGHFDDSPAELVEEPFLELGLDELLERRALAMVGGADQAGLDRG